MSEFTPFGYLRNPAHVARNWGDTSGGNLRTASDYVGVEWVYPVGREATSHAGIGVEVEVREHAYRTREDFAAIGLTSRYHSALIMGFDWRLDGVECASRYFLVDDDTLAVGVEVHNTTLDPRSIEVKLAPRVDASTLAHNFSISGGEPAPGVLAPGERRSSFAVLQRGTPRAVQQPEIEATHARLLDADARFSAGRPRLAGDWPAHWAEGLHHDFETTRMLVQPPGGIFRDVWPAWMVAWPRVVLAEGTLDMLRLAYADPSTAQRAVTSMFRDAPSPNVPCVFRGGEPNMVAADGSVCGTSPAWCLPFLNLELLYLRTLDRDWLGQVYPFAAAYVDWWLEQRADAQGWIVYKCTWESGEDGNPRLDPSGSGDGDISRRIRPVELQAALSHAASVLAFFAAELGLPSQRWTALAADYRERTRQLFDPDQGRYCDWLIAERRFQRPCPETPYWNVDACRESAQSLTPLLVGLPIARDEVRRHARPPWSLWPSWTWSLVESAAAGGYLDVVGDLSSAVVDRVYRTTTRRDVAALARPMPGSAPEFWPEDWRAYGGSDAYGWGATTANLLIRHLFGFKESRRTDGCVFCLAPALPRWLMRVGARYGLENVTYRGCAFDVWYTVESATTLRAEAGGHAFALVNHRARDVVLP